MACQTPWCCLCKLLTNTRLPVGRRSLSWPGGRREHTIFSQQIQPSKTRFSKLFFLSPTTFKLSVHLQQLPRLTFRLALTPSGSYVYTDLCTGCLINQEEAEKRTVSLQSPELLASFQHCEEPGAEFERQSNTLEAARTACLQFLVSPRFPQGTLKRHTTRTQ